ncbi:MAG TPA: Gfo/Idh/MocA family oxidoreductase [Acetobacteraceae bacterium]|nr:Gfo/Idh/MocA family oxidoreductase [Acetobacteraceae bacterium]
MSDPSPFRLGLVGAGRMGLTHLRALSTSKTVRITAIADPFATAHAALPCYADISVMLDAGNLDGVLVAAPTPHHLSLIETIAAAGLPILCEKPCGLTAAQARAAAAIAQRHNVRLQIAYWRRFVPALQRLRRAIAAGEFGEIYCVNCYQWDGEPPSAQFQASSGGIFIDMGVHEFDQVRWLTGSDIVHITAATHPTQDAAQALATLSNGATALVSLGRRYPLGDVCRVEVFGERDSQDCRFLWPPDTDTVFLQALRHQAEAFARGDTTGATAEDAVAALAAAEQAA